MNDTEEMVGRLARVRDGELTGQASTAGARTLLASIVAGSGPAGAAAGTGPATAGADPAGTGTGIGARIEVGAGRAAGHEGRRTDAGRRTGRWHRPGTRPRSWTVVGGGLVAAAAVALAVTVAAPGGEPVRLSPGAGTSATAQAGQPDARRILLAAASATVTGAAKASSDGAYWRVRTVTEMPIVDPTGRYLLRHRVSDETWLARRPGGRSVQVRRDLGTRPATPEDEAAWRAAGSPRTWRYSTDPLATRDKGYVHPWRRLSSSPGTPVATPLTGMPEGKGGTLLTRMLTWDEFQEIPDEAGRLRAYLEERIIRELMHGNGGDPDLRMERVLQKSCVDLIVQLPVTPEVRAAAYEILAALPGMRSEGEVTDPLGRTGQAVGYRSEDGRRDLLFVIEPGSGRPLAGEERFDGRLADGRTVRVGAVTAYQESGWTDEQPPVPSAAEEERALKPGEVRVRRIR
ncbi:CU044_5270 family protein [Streptosporangium sandarakinum]|uniref:CU044_5270 family protein n=1 Tax=Streptosporangium sandarakinum TaxID=1260955 RepID=UPI00341CC17A